MRKATNRLLLGLVGVASTFGLILGGKAIVEGNKVEAVEVAAAEATTATQTSFSSVSSNNIGGDTAVSYQAYKGGASTAPAINDNEIRIYQGSETKDGGLLRVAAKDGYKISSITIGTSMSTKVVYYIDADVSNNVVQGTPVITTPVSIAKGAQYTVSNINASSVVFACRGGDKSSRLYLNYLSVDYVADGGGLPEDAVPYKLNLDYGSGQTEYVVGSIFNSEGYSLTLQYADSNGELVGEPIVLSLPDERIEFLFEDENGLNETGMHNVYATFNDGVNEPIKSNSIQIEVVERAAEFLIEFSGVMSGTSYSDRTLNYPDYGIAMSFTGTAVNSSGSSIKDLPIFRNKDNKYGSLTIVSEEPIGHIDFNLIRWNNDDQTMNLSVGNSTSELIDTGISVSFGDGSSSYQESALSYDGTAYCVFKIETTEGDGRIALDSVNGEFGAGESAAELYAEEFLSVNLCDGGVTAPSTDTWNSLKDSFAELSDDDKALFATYKADAASDDYVAQCVARYDYIVGKYGSDTYEDFMGRNPSPISGAYVVNASGMDNSIFAVAGIACAAVLATGVLLLIRKKQRA